jgi:hypothetical protein
MTGLGIAVAFLLLLWLCLLYVPFRWRPMGICTPQSTMARPARDF